MKRQRKKILVFFLILSIFITSGFTNISKAPQTLYRVYIKGESIGLIKSKVELENYIDKKQEEIKTIYKVDKVYIPEDLDIVKEKTYDKNIKSVEKIYEEIKDTSPFTISGYVIKIRGLDTKTENGKVVKGTTQKIYVLDKKVFTTSVEKTVKSFIAAEDYDNYANKTQKKIEDVGKYIEDISIKNKITIKKAKIPVDKKIYMDEMN